MLENIKIHSLLVARVAIYLGRLVSLYSKALNIRLIEAGSLLHDIAKTRCLQTGENHALKGSQYLQEQGYFELGPIVANHVRLLKNELLEEIDEEKIVNYADKRVLHDKVVTLNTRIADLLQRYGKTEEKKKRISLMGERMKVLEGKIFRDLPISPDHILQLNNNRSFF